jgi:hypothetical protein
MLLFVCVLNMAAAAVLYALWLHGTGVAEGTRRAREGTITMRAASEIMEQARILYGGEAVDGTWNADKMDKNLHGGTRGCG